MRAARRAYPGWCDTPQSQRSALLVKCGQLIAEHVEELARLQVHENGKTIVEMRAASQSCARAAAYYAQLAQMHHSYTIDHRTAEPPGLDITKPDRRGRCDHSMWNNPLGLLVLKLFPAVAVGNTVMIKPSEVTPVSTLRLAEFAVEAGIPKGVVNVVTGGGGIGRGAGRASLGGQTGIHRDHDYRQGDRPSRSRTLRP